jgi:hypothetical protein
MLIYKLLCVLPGDVVATQFKRDPRETFSRLAIIHSQGVLHFRADVMIANKGFTDRVVEEPE